MLCSNCSEEVRPVVAMDIDGTLGDYHSHFLNFLESYLGHPILLWDPFDLHLQKFSEWCCDQWGISIETYREIKLAYRQGAQKRSMPMFPGAAGICGAIRDAGAELWLTTTRPYLSLDNVVPDTVFWLRLHDIEYDGMLFDDDKYAVLASRVDPERVVAVFDDLPEYVDGAQQHFPGRSWFVRNEWNRGVSRPLQCDLDATADLALNAIYTWKGNYGG